MREYDLGYWHQYVDIDGKYYSDKNGWPCSFVESTWGIGLMAAINGLPHSNSLDSEQGEIEGLSRIIFDGFESGRSAKHQRNQPASGKSSEEQIRKLHKLIDGLSDHLSLLNKPVLDVLKMEGFELHKFSESLDENKEIVRYAFGLLDPSSLRGSTETKLVARIVCEIAAQVFEYVENRHATFSTDVVTSERSGDWPVFLERVYKTLRIDASVSSQVAALSKKRNGKRPQ